MTNSKPTEEWRKIDGLPDYSVSSLGRVRRDTDTRRKGRAGTTYAGKILRPNNVKGYHRYTMYTSDGNRTQISAHRLVATVFIPNPGNKPQVNHIDCDRKNNRVSNLEWVTAAENIAHGFAFGDMVVGERHHAAKLTEGDVIKIRSLNGKLPQRKIGAMFGITQAHVGYILRRDVWKHI